MALGSEEVKARAGDIVVIGSGSLASSVCCAIAAMSTEPIAVHIVGRSRQKVEALCYIAGTTAVLAGRPVSFHAISTGGSAFDDHLGQLLRDVKPVGVFVCAAPQSPWEAPSAWTGLLERVGFGLALPLLADFAVLAGRVIRETRPGTWLVNACFPDVVNPVLAALDIPIVCGVGNVATMAASLQAAMGLPDQSRLHVLAHHAQLHLPHSPDDEALAWFDGVSVPDVTALLAAQRATGRQVVNQVTGRTAALLLHALLTGADVDAHVPGPGGLPGGYPVRVHNGRVVLRLPAGVTITEAVAVNQRASRRDGVRVVGGEVHFEAAVTDEVPGLATGFAVSELTTIGRYLLELREDLRARPHPQRTELV